MNASNQTATMQHPASDGTDPAATGTSAGSAAVNLGTAVGESRGSEKPSRDSLKAQVHQLSFWYGKFQALTGVDFPVYNQAVTALIGASGCGKSTLLRCFNRMHDIQGGHHYQGSIRMQPEDMDLIADDTDPMLVRLRIGMVFQQANPFPKSIFENVASGLRIRGIKDRTVLQETVEQSLKRAALWEEVKDRLHKPAFELSGGQQQRLCIARTLAPEPELLLLDEPTSSLDPIATAMIEELISNLSRDVTILIVTHNMQQAARISDYTALMHMGELIEHDDTEVIFKNPREERTLAYITGRFG